MNPPEDTNRYTAPPAPPAEEPTYNGHDILRYVYEWLPMGKRHEYTLEEVRDLLMEAAEMLGDPDLGIHSL
jgi:hypothetical protein